MAEDVDGEDRVDAMCVVPMFIGRETVILIYAILEAPMSYTLMGRVYWPTVYPFMSCSDALLGCVPRIPLGCDRMARLFNPIMLRFQQASFHCPNEEANVINLT
ncbi:Uncharacterized protein DAT39_014386 [Clarias magur]|uniref:Uncharacterized protein n=1 Tax=Clarias magur TaxID=1594786 RepID=A0A8J4TR72_CLAMG|nr:Uncharacterized protein DAT39_014386 [Clarias magur]